MFSRPDLTREICAVIGVTIGRKHPDWITEAVMKRHPVPPGVDGEFYVLLLVAMCARSSQRR